VSEQQVLLEAVAASALQNELALQRVDIEPDRGAPQRVEVLERDRGRMQRVQGCKRMRRK